MRTYICAPISSEDPSRVVGNCHMALGFAEAVREAYGESTITFSFEVVLNGWLDDNDELERRLGMNMSNMLLKCCNAVRIMPGVITDGMRHEIGLALACNISIYIGLDSAKLSDVAVYNMLNEGRTP